MSSATTAFLRLAAAVQTYDQVMRTHIFARLEQVFGPDRWEDELLDALSEDRQLDFLHGYPPLQIEQFLELKDFDRIVRWHRRHFPEFTDRDLSRISNATSVRNRFAHFANYSPAGKWIDGKTQVLARLVKKMDEGRAARLDAVGRHLRAFVPVEAAPQPPGEPGAPQPPAGHRDERPPGSEAAAADREPNPGSTLVQDLHEYRSHYNETSLGTGWRRSVHFRDWWVTRWIGRTKGKTRICVFAPAKRADAGWISASDGSLISETVSDEDAGFRRLLEAERSGEIDRLTREAIAGYERRSAPHAAASGRHPAEPS